MLHADRVCVCVCEEPLKKKNESFETFQTFPTFQTLTSPLACFRPPTGLLVVPPQRLQFLRAAASRGLPERAPGHREQHGRTPERGWWVGCGEAGR